jgi:hypothetical protein
MDPVTTAIIAAVEAGANRAAGDVAKKTLVDCYDGLKALLKKKFGNESDVADAVDRLEKQSDPKGCRQTVEDEIVAVKAGADPELLAPAQALFDQIKAMRGAKHNVQVAHGTGIAQARDASSASVIFHGSPPPPKND